MPEEKDITEEYEAIKKKHNLPELKELDKEFCIGKLEETEFLLRGIITKMNERLEQALKILGDIIQPENNLANMYEAEGFSDEEKKNIFELFKRISYYHKELLMKDYDYDEDSAAELINKTFKEWKELKQEFLKILDKVKQYWKKETKSRLELGYFG